MRQIKKYALIFLTILLGFSCNIDHSKNATTFNYMLYKERNDTTSFLSYKDNCWHSKEDSLLQKVTFNYKHRDHEIRLFTNIADTDGKVFSYELDSIGIIYSRASAYRNFMQLTCNNDSITEIITVAMAHIILEPDLRCIGCNNSKYIKPYKYILPDNTKL